MNVAAVILAAGKSERFGSPKALAPWGQRSFSEQIVLTAEQAGLTPRVLVLGHRAEEIAQVLHPLPVELITNTNYEAGQFSSLQAALATLRSRCEGAVVCLVDQPQVTAETLRLVKDEVLRDPQRLVVPSVRGRGVHPVGIGKAWFDDILGMPPVATLRDFLRAHRDTVHRLQLTDLLLLRDVDTPEDLNEVWRIAASRRP